MADTYGYNAQGGKIYDPGQYDQWGVYMGNRAPLRAQSNVATPGFNAYAPGPSFEDWLPNYAKIQLARGRGSLPEVTAQQGTPEYRDQVAKAQEAAQWIIDRGGTVGDMGIRPAKGAGLNTWNQFQGYKGGVGQLSPAFRAMAKQYYDKMAGAGAATPKDTSTVDTPDPNAQPDLWPTNPGMEGALPSYNAPKYAPPDSWGGWSGTYGNNPGGTAPIPAAANPAGLSQPSIVPPAALTPSTGIANPMNNTQGGITPPATPAQPSIMGSAGGTAAPPTVGRGMLNRRKRPAGTGWGGIPKTTPGYDGSGINPQASIALK